MSQIQHLPNSFRKLVELIEEKKQMTPQLAAQFMTQADIQPLDVMPWADFGHPKADGYGRKMVYDGGFFEIMVMSWVPGDFSSIHDHGTAQWGAVKSLGQGEHAVFEMRDNILKTRCRTPFVLGDINAVTHELIHQMGNVDQAPFCSVHLYGSYDHNGDITGDSRIFDLLEHKTQYTTGGVFFCLPESDINRRSEGVEADYPTFLRHHVEMHKRIKTMLPFSDEPDKLREKAEMIEGQLFSQAGLERFQRELNALLDDQGRIVDPAQWHIFWHEAHVAARYKASL